MIVSDTTLLTYHYQKFSTVESEQFIHSINDKEEKSFLIEQNRVSRFINLMSIRATEIIVVINSYLGTV